MYGGQRLTGEMKRWCLGMAALALGAGCGLDVSGTAEPSGRDDAGTDVWVPLDAAGSTTDSWLPPVADATTETASVGDDAPGSTADGPMVVWDALDEADAPALDATVVDGAGDDAATVDAAGTDAAAADGAATEGGRTDGAASDGGGTDGAGSDAGRSDAATLDASCAGVFCHGVCTTDTDCHACSGADLLCAATNTCLADCTTCGTATTACYMCDVNRANPVGTCGDKNAGTADCLSGAYAYHCGCTTVAGCPGETQVCAAPASGTAPPNWCYTCGENVPMAAGTCKNGKTCNAATGQCN
jgi:hypothetical protein